MRCSFTLYEGTFHSTKTPKNSDIREIWFGNFMRKFPKNPKIVGFLKSESFNRKFRKILGRKPNGTEVPG